MIPVKIKLESPECMPVKASDGASGFDLISTREIRLCDGRRALVPTGVCVAIPKGYEGQIRPRSGLAIEHGITVLNSPGTIDSDFRGEIKVILINFGYTSFLINKGDRIAQLTITPVPHAQFEIVSILPQTWRGTKGFGSTGK